MAKKIFEDMVRVKREKKRLSSSDLKPKNKVRNKTPKKIKKQPIRSEIKSEIKSEAVNRAQVTESQPRAGVFDSGLDELASGASAGLGVVNTKDSSSRLMWFVAIASVIGFLFALSFLFSKAKITIVPVQKEIVLNKDFYAVKDSVTALPFDIIIMNGVEETTISAEEREEVSKVARGKVRIYNNYSNQSQTLLVDTRLEGSNGLIYMTDKQVTIPGRNSEGTPGSIEVDIYATEPGEEYNSEPLDFTIVGFKGSPKYDAFYARSVSDLSGGVVGYLPVASDVKKSKAVLELKNKLKDRLLNKAKEQIPDGFILFKDAVFLEVNKENVDLKTEGSIIPVGIEGTLYGFLFKEEDLSQAIIESSLDVEPEEIPEMYISNLDALTFNILKQPESLKDVKSINFTLSGRQNVVWIVDSSSIITELLGLKKKDFSKKMLEYPTVDSADLILKPIWRKSIPDEIKKVDIKVEYPE